MLLVAAMVAVASPAATQAQEPAPGVAITDGPRDPTNDATPTFSFSSPADPQPAFLCRVDGAEADFAACTSPFTSAPLPDGRHVFTVRAPGLPGQPEDSRAFTVDTAAPDTAIQGGPGGPTNATAATFGLFSEDGAAFTCTPVRPGGSATGPAACGPEVTYDLPQEGDYTLSASATDAAGNADPTPATRTFTVDRTPPAAPDVSSAAGGYAFAGEPGATFECRLDTPFGAGTYAACTSPQAVWTPVPGRYVFSVRAVDRAGNAGPATARELTSPGAAPVTPRFHASVVVRPAGGTVLVRRRGSARYAPLTRSQLLPLGSTVDARRGSVTLLAAPRAHAAAQKAVFADGVFRITQPGAATVLTLSEALAPCGKRAAAAGRPRTRRLSGKGSGAFRTRGRYSTAAGGTRWLVQDTCAGTVTRVLEGLAAVRDDVRHRTVLVRAGKRYLARPRRR